MGNPYRKRLYREMLRAVRSPKVRRFVRLHLENPVVRVGDLVIRCGSGTMTYEVPARQPRREPSAGPHVITVEGTLTHTWEIG